MNPGSVSYLLIVFVNAAVYFGILEALTLLVTRKPSNAAERV